MIPQREQEFGRWLRQQRRRDDPVGDLARDVIRSGCRARTALGVRQRLDEHDASDGARQALSRAIHEYATALLAGVATV
jgi:hypothetical protein